MLATLLPEPDSPTIPSVSPRSTSKETPSTALTTPSSVVEVDLQVLDLEQARSWLAHWYRTLGSR